MTNQFEACRRRYSPRAGDCCVDGITSGLGLLSHIEACQIVASRHFVDPCLTVGQFLTPNFVLLEIRLIVSNALSISTWFAASGSSSLTPSFVESITRLRILASSVLISVGAPSVAYIIATAFSVLATTARSSPICVHCFSEIINEADPPSRLFTFRPEECLSSNLLKWRLNSSNCLVRFTKTHYWQ